MYLIYELIDLYPPEFEPIFAPRLNRLFLFLREHPGLSEPEACIQFLGDAEQGKYFNKMKTQLRAQLGHFLIAWPSSPDKRYKTVFYDCYKDFTVYKLFLLQSKRTLAIEIAKSLVPRLEKLEIHSLLYQVAQDLFMHHAVITGSSRSMRKYERMAEKQLEIVRAESMVRLYYGRIGFICNTRDSFTPSVVREVQEAAEHVTPLLRLGSSQLNRFIYSIIVTRYVVTYDNKNIVKYCNEALNIIPDNHPNSRALRFSFMHKQVLSLLALGDSDKAKSIAKEACEMVSIGGFNWHLAFIKRIIICFYREEYQEAYELYKAHKQQKKVHDTAREYWNIIHGYLHFLIQAEKIKPYTQERFNLGKFLNEVPVHSRDKAGQNINILVIQILTRMQRGEFGKIIDRIESLNAYARTYTKTPATKRANLFINMIVKMEAAHFHRSATELKTKILHRKLQETPVKFGQNLAVEIIPYPVLWAEILLMLRDQPRARTVRKTTIG